jgi:hypothetical protein
VNNKRKWGIIQDRSRGERLIGYMNLGKRKRILQSLNVVESISA